MSGKHVGQTQISDQEVVIFVAQGTQGTMSCRGYIHAITLLAEDHLEGTCQAEMIFHEKNLGLVDGLNL